MCITYTYCYTLHPMTVDPLVSDLHGIVFQLRVHVENYPPNFENVLHHNITLNSPSSS